MYENISLPLVPDEGILKLTDGNMSFYLVYAHTQKKHIHIKSCCCFGFFLLFLKWDICCINLEVYCISCLFIHSSALYIVASLSAFSSPCQY